MDDQVKKPSGLFDSMLKLGKAIGLAAAILLTPQAFALSQPALLRYLAPKVGIDLGVVLTWVMGGIEAYLIYHFVALLLTFLVVWLLTALAARGFRQ